MKLSPSTYFSPKYQKENFFNFTVRCDRRITVLTLLGQFNPVRDLNGCRDQLGEVRNSSIIPGISTNSTTEIETIVKDMSIH